MASKSTHPEDKAAWLTRLRAGVYLAPDIGSDFFEAILNYLKSELGLNYTSLIYESTENNTTDQIENHEVDIAWVSYQKFFELVEAKRCCRLLSASTVHNHPKLSQAQAGDLSFGIYSDVVIHSSLKGQVKEMFDLRGHRWAYTSPQLYSGHGITMEKLKTLGENANFFGDYNSSQSHLHSLELVLARKCDAAAVDSNVLQAFLHRNEHLRKELHVLTSWGPLPPAPILVNSHIGSQAEQLLTDTLLNMHTTAKGMDILSKYGVVKFGANSLQNYSFLTKQYIKKPRNSGTTTTGPNKTAYTKLISLTTNQFESPYY